MSDRIPDEIVEKLWEELNVGAPPSRGHLRRALEAVLPDLQQPQPGEPHEIDRAFYDLTVKERDFERQRADQLAAKCEQLTQEALDERATFRAMLEKFKDDDSSPIQRELADAILERDAMREANAAGDADGIPLAQTVGYWQDRALDYATRSDHLRVEVKQTEAERDARPDLSPEELAICQRALSHFNRYDSPAAQSAWEKLGAQR